MKNQKLSINEVSKAEKCECTEVCEACAEKYAHTFDESPKYHTNITSDVIAEIVLSNVSEENKILEHIIKIKSYLTEVEEYVKSRKKNH